MEGAVTTAGNSDRPLHIVFLARSLGFPEGTAATNRVRLLGRALVEQGADVGVLCTRVSELPDRVLNHLVRGECDGIRFLYTPGTTVRSNSFIMRRWREAQGFVTALHELARLRRRGRLDCVCFVDSTHSWQPGVWLMRRYLTSVDVPVVSQLNEHSGSLPAWLPGKWTRFFSHLDSVSGVIAISGWLADWAAVEAIRIRRQVRVIEVPIVVDTSEQKASPYPAGSRTFVYAASASYLRDTCYLLSAMGLLWQEQPALRLVVTGVDAERAGWLADLQGQRPLLDDPRVEMRGHISRDELLVLYRHAAALLAPLHDEQRSRARFPTKIGEYLAAARPVITTNVGEVGRYLRDGETAYVALSDEIVAFSAKMAEAAADPKQAAIIGVAGRRVAEESFQYSLQGPRLILFFERLARA